MAVSDGFDGGDVQERNQRPAIGSRKGDEKATAHHDGQARVADFVSVPAAKPDPERLKRLLIDKFVQFGSGHAQSVPDRNGDFQSVTGLKG